MEFLTTKYQPAEILQIIRANYLQQQQFDDIALKDQELEFETTICEWGVSHRLIHIPVG